MTVLFDDMIHVHYGFLYLAGDETPDLTATRRGQQNGLCGAAVPGALSMVTGLHTGALPLVVEWLPTEPAVGPEWEDVVEVPFEPFEPEITLSSFDHYIRLELPETGSYRARFSAFGMDAGRTLDTAHQVPAPDRYLLQLWPAAARPDAVVRQGSQAAQYWHEHARSLPPPPSAEEQADAAAAAERAQAERDRQLRAAAIARWTEEQWDGRPPSARLAALGGNISLVAQNHRDLLDAFERLPDDEQRDLARWLAHRAFERADIADLDWVRPALLALDRGQPMPEPFTQLDTAFERLNEPGEIGITTITADVSTAAPTFAWALDDPSGPRLIHRPSFAVPALFSALEPDPLQALVDTFSHAAATFDEDCDTLITELGSRLP